MAEENDDSAVALEDMELESVDNNMDLRIMMESGVVDEEETDKFADGYTDPPIKEKDEYLRGNSDTRKVLLVKKSPTKDSDFPVSQLTKKPDLVIVGPNHKFEVRSRYRSASLGSCHDLCKFGHKHEPEKKTRRPVLRTTREAQPLFKAASGDLEKYVQEKEAKKKDVNRRLSLSGPIPEKATPLMRREDNNLPKKDTDWSKMKRVQSEIKPSTLLSPGTSSRSKTDTQAVRKIVTHRSNFQKSSTQKVIETKPWKVVGSYVKGEKEVNAEEPQFRSPETLLKKKEVGLSKGEREIKAKETMSNSPRTPLKKSSSLKARLFKDRKSSSSSKTRVNPENAEIDGPDDITEKTLCMIEPNTNIKPEEKTSNTCVPGENSRVTRASKTKANKGNRKGNGLSLLPSSSGISSRPLGDDQQGSEVTKNKQIGIKTEDGGSKTRTIRAKSTVTRRLKNLDIKNTRQIDTVREGGWSKTNTSRAKSTLDPKSKLVRKDKSHLEEKDVSAWKVKFKRGTVISLQTTNNAPKKLRFKRGKILGEDQNAKAEVKLKNEYDLGIEPQDTEVGPEKVHLRHQEASEKKDDVDLNDVIEETANKLVKTRKSKVKALVGAFETVMSLRDRKRLVDTSAS